MEDKRVTEAKALSTGLPTIVAKVITDIVEYAEERLRVNVGLVSENGSLKAKLRTPEAIDLSTVETSALLAEISKRTKE